MSLVDVNTLIRTYLLTSSVTNDPLIALIAVRMYQGRLPVNVTLPAISYFVRGGGAFHKRPAGVYPSIQFDCWAEDVAGPPFVSGAITARQVYRALYDALQGLGNALVVVGGNNYYIVQAMEEVQGQDLQDVDIPGYFRVTTFFQVTIRDDL